MNILFLGLLYTKDEEKTLLSKSSCGLQSAANTYQWNLIKGLDEIPDCHLQLLSTLPVGTYPRYYKDIIIPSKTWSHFGKVEDKEIGYINLPVLKQIIRLYRFYKEINLWCTQHKNEEVCILSYSLYLPYLKVLHAIKSKFRKLNICLIVPDLPNRHGFIPSGTIVKRFAYNFCEKLQYRYIKAADTFVLLTGNMVAPLHIKDQPYVVIEGICNIPPIKTISGILEPGIPTPSIPASSVPVIPVPYITFLYSGALQYGFGIDNMIAAFQSIPGNNYRLFICGTGDYKREVEKASMVDNRITYFGYVSKDKILSMQQKATILINPRLNVGDYTKYSFPSKLIEYMASARPILSFKLDGIPPEYDNYLYYMKGNTVESIAYSMLKISSKPLSELEIRGKDAREFVMQKKSSIVQAGRLFDILKTTHTPSILHINITCQFGSTGRIVETLHNYVINQGFQSHVAYSAYRCNLKNSFKIESKIENYLRRALNRFLGRKYIHSVPGTLRLIKKIKRLQPNIIHLHNIQQNSVHFPLLLKFLKKYNVPIVYTLNDCWPFTGGCYHFTQISCIGYQSGCMKCPLKAEERDVCNKPAGVIYAEKSSALHALDSLQLICVSNWQKSCAEQSFMKDLPLHVIYNGVDTDIFKPVISNIRKDLGISEDKFVILGVANFWTKQKGIDIFLKLSQSLAPIYRIILVGELAENVPQNIITVNRTDDPKELVRLYSAADVYLNASREEAFGLTAAEAMACGTPVIAYQSTACGEVVSQETGIVLDSFNIEDLLQAIAEVRLDGKTKYTKSCLNRVRELFSKDVMLKNYFDIYKRLL
jgi:putative colanic acid biosynthesis glycosyltransferase